jgi:hypothetical protein
MNFRTFARNVCNTHIEPLRQPYCRFVLLDAALGASFSETDCLSTFRVFSEILGMASDAKFPRNILSYLNDLFGSPEERQAGNSQGTGSLSDCSFLDLPTDCIVYLCTNFLRPFEIVYLSATCRQFVEFLITIALS